MAHPARASSSARFLTMPECWDGVGTTAPLLAALPPGEFCPSTPPARPGWTFAPGGAWRGLDGCWCGGTRCSRAPPAPSPRAASPMRCRFQGRIVLERVLPEPSGDVVPRPAGGASAAAAAAGCVGAGCGRRRGDTLPPACPRGCRGRESLAVWKQSLRFLASAATAAPEGRGLVWRARAGWAPCSGRRVMWTGLGSLRHLGVLCPPEPLLAEAAAVGAPRSVLPVVPAPRAAPRRRASLRQRAGRWYPAAPQRLHRGQGCAWKELPPWAWDLGWDFRLSCWGRDGHGDGEEVASRGCLLLCDLGPGPSSASVCLRWEVSPLIACCPMQPRGVEGQLWMRAGVGVSLGS